MAMDSYDAIQVGKAYVRLGWAVQEQLDDLMAEGPDADVNRNAVTDMRGYAREIAPYAQDAAEEILLATDEWLKTAGYEVGTA